MKCWRTVPSPLTTSCVCGYQPGRQLHRQRMQDVYRLQGVKINDKHIEVIASDAAQVRDPSAGDTDPIEGEQVEVARVKMPPTVIGCRREEWANRHILMVLPRHL